MEAMEFRFVYHPDDRPHELDAYNAGQALYGISRSLSIVTHYMANGHVITQAPALKGAKLFVRPPKAGSFEFLVTVIPWAEVGMGIGASIAAAVLYDLTKLVYRRASGLSERPETERVNQILRERPGDIDALNDTTDTDVVRWHRPFEGAVINLNIYGGQNNFGTFDRSTFEYAKAREVGRSAEKFVGSVASYNGNADTGRIWLQSESRTVAFKRDRSLKSLPDLDRRLLSWSLDQYVNHRPADIALIGHALRNREEKLKEVFVLSVDSP